jgi:hypothetical protein
MRIRHAIAAAALAAGMVVSAPAGAYVRTVTDKSAPVHWGTTCLWITTHFTEPPAYLTTDLAVSAAQAAGAAWSRPQVGCTDLELHVVNSPDLSADVANDQHSNVFFRTGQWCRDANDPTTCYDPSALAITTVFAMQTSGQIVDADTEINAVNFTWGDLVAKIGDTGLRATDLQNTLTHEFGHLLGLDHNCHSPADRKLMKDQNGVSVPECTRAPPAVQEATMFNAVMMGDVERRTLAQDDTDGVCAIYPARAAADCTVRDETDPTVEVPGANDKSGGCSVSSAHRPATAGLWLLVVPALIVLRRRFSARRSG